MNTMKYLKGLLALSITHMCCADVFDNLALAFTSLAPAGKIAKQILDQLQSKDFIDLSNNTNKEKRKTFYDTHLKQLIIDGLNNRSLDINMQLPTMIYNYTDNNSTRFLNGQSLLVEALVNKDLQTVKKLLISGANYNNVITDRLLVKGPKQTVMQTKSENYTDISRIMLLAPEEILDVFNDLKVDLSAPDALGDIPLGILLKRYAEIRAQDIQLNSRETTVSQQMRDVILKAINLIDLGNINKTIKISDSVNTIKGSLLSIATLNKLYCGHEIIKALLDKGADGLSQGLSLSKAKQFKVQELKKDLLFTPLLNIWQRFISQNDSEDENLILAILKNQENINKKIQLNQLLGGNGDMEKNGEFVFETEWFVQDLLDVTTDDARKKFENHLQK